MPRLTNTILAISLVLICAFLFLHYSKRNPSPNVKQSVGNVSVTRPSSNANELDGPPKPQTKRGPAIASIDKSEYTRLEQDQEVWSKARGFSDEYSIYFTNTAYLKELAAQQDMLAIQMLGFLRMGFPDGNEYLMEAAKLGSIQALHFLSNAATAAAEGRYKTQTEQSVSPIDQRSAAVDALAFQFAASLRGDNFASPNNTASLMTKLTYTDGDIAAACERGRNVYDELRSKRLEAGLAEFNDTRLANGSEVTPYERYCPREQ